MRLAIAVVTLALLPSLVALAPAAAQERDERQGISWPSRDFPTLQSAVDALSDGGTLRIAAGVFRLEQPLMIEGKRLIIEGAGCHPARPGRGAGQPLLPARGGPERPDRTTTLVGPAPLGVVEAGRAAGLLSYVGGGGVVRGVRLTGFDAGIVTRDGARGAIPLVVQDACISATGRGILALGGGAVSVVDSEISATMSNAISVKPTFTGSLVLAPYLTVNGAAFVDPGGACVYVSGALAFIGGSVLANCLGRGVAGFQATIVLFDSFIINSRVAGVALQDSGIWMVNNIINGTSSAFTTPGFLGDGVLAASSTGTFTNNQIVQSERAGLSSFGSTLSLSGNTILCSAFDIDVEELNGTPGVVQDLGGNQCGCGQTGQCVAASSSLQAPTPIGGLE